MELATFVFSLLYLAIFIYLNNGLQKNKKARSHVRTDNVTPRFISVVCPFRNEKNNLLNFLNSLEKQRHPKDQFEVILVDDHSEDGGVDFIRSIIGQFKTAIQIHSLTNQLTSKKAALILGISKSKGELILTTDCDTSREENWISSFVNEFDSKNPDMILGPVRIKPKNTLFSSFQSLEFLSLQLVTAGFAGNDNAILSNGANLAFRRDSLLRVEGYSNQKTASGDDFFLMMLFKKAGMRINFNNRIESIVSVDPSNSIASFINQRLRWAGKTIYANDVSFYAAGIVNTGLSLFLVALPFYEVYLHSFPYLSCSIYSIKFVGDAYLLKKSAKDYGLEIRLGDLLLSFLIYPIYISYIFMLSLFKKPTWKGRQI